MLYILCNGNPWARAIVQTLILTLAAAIIIFVPDIKVELGLNF